MSNVIFVSHTSPNKDSSKTSKKKDKSAMISAKTGPTSILDIPRDILLQIFSMCTAQDVARVILAGCEQFAEYHIAIILMR